jgi:hypothetical protein
MTVDIQLKAINDEAVNDNNEAVDDSVVESRLSIAGGRIKAAN